jgi:malate/lactate dehydrogenase
MSFINTTLDSKRKHGMVTFIDTLRFDTEIKEKEQE